MTRSTLEELLARCERATGPDREIDLDMMAAFLPRHRVIEAMGIDDLMRFPQTWQSDVGWRDAERVAYTSSLDAIVGLIRSDLGWYWRAGHGSVGNWVNGRLLPGWCHLNRVHPDSCEKEDESTGYGATAALACCSAYIRAKLSSPGGDE